MGGVVMSPNKPGQLQGAADRQARRIEEAVGGADGAIRHAFVLHALAGQGQYAAGTAASRPPKSRQNAGNDRSVRNNGRNDAAMRETAPIPGAAKL
jgi:hypothetical protein